MVFAAAFIGTAASAQGVSTQLGQMLAQVRAFSAASGESLWPGYGSAPSGFLLVDADKEVLLCQPGTPEGFTADGIEPMTRCQRWSRPRTNLPATLLAALPILGQPSTIVMGTPEGTGKPLASWLRTILHEHFHQWQTAQPDYYKRVEKLDLSGSDKTGMWMLNFPFPYDRAPVASAYTAASNALADALELRGKSGFSAAFDRYLAARRRFAGSVSKREWRYIDFQLWQEGVARWTEMQLGKMYPDAAVRASAVALEQDVLAQLRKPDLARQKRELVYPFGAGEAMLMSACGSAWRESYLSVLGNGDLLAAARKACPR